MNPDLGSSEGKLVHFTCKEKKALYNCKWPKFKYDCLDLDTAASRGRGCRIRGTGEDSRRWDSGRNGRSDPCQRILCWSRGHLKDEAGEATLGQQSLSFRGHGESGESGTRYTFITCLKFFSRRQERSTAIKTNKGGSCLSFFLRWPNKRFRDRTSQTRQSQRCRQ